MIKRMVSEVEFHVGDKGFDEEIHHDPDSGKITQSLEEYLTLILYKNKIYYQIMVV